MWLKKKITKKPKAKKVSIRRLKQKVWAAFSLYIRERDHWTCFTCGKQDRGRMMHAGHFISRSHSSTLFDEKNVHAQCAVCNMYKNGNLHVYAERFIEKYGYEEFRALNKRGTELKQFTSKELQSLLERYERVID